MRRTARSSKTNITSLAATAATVLFVVWMANAATTRGNLFARPADVTADAAAAPQPAGEPSLEVRPYLAPPGMTEQRRHGGRVERVQPRHGVGVRRGPGPVEGVDGAESCLLVGSRGAAHEFLALIGGIRRLHIPAAGWELIGPGADESAAAAK